jgi:hypothetical protein
MSSLTRKPGTTKVVILACLATVLGAGYVQNALSSSHDGSSSAGGAEVVIAVDQKPTFLAYVKRHQMRSRLVDRVAVGDILPDSGVTYYDIPLHYGAPFYRCAVIGEQVVIADPRSGRVIQVVD